MERLKMFLLNLLTKGRHDTYGMETVRQILMLNAGGGLCIVVLVVLGVVSMVQGSSKFWMANFIIAGLSLLLLLYARQSQNYHFSFAAVIVIFTLTCLYLLVSGGPDQTGYLWCFAYPLVACFGLGARKGALAATVFMVATLLLFFLEPLTDLIVKYPLPFKIRFIAAFAFVTGLSFIAEMVREATFSELNAKNAELKINAEKLQQESEALEGKVDERTKQLSDANRQLMEEINERKRVADALRENEQLFRFITENMADVISILDTDIHYIYVSPSVERIRGYTPEEVKAQTIEQIMTPDSRSRFIAAIREERQQESSGAADPDRVRLLELEQYVKNGDTVWVENIISFIRNADRKAVGILAVSRDITERKRIEEALRKSEEKYRLIAENIANVITIFDMNLKMIYASPSVLRLRGFTPEEAASQKMDQIMTPESLQRTQAIVEEELKLEASGSADPNRVRIVEFEEYRKDGTTVWVEDTISFLRDQDRKAVGILVMGRDLTERKQAEAEKARLEEQLKQAQKLESIGTLAGGLAHDFNNLLMAIQGYVALMMLDMQESHPHHERLKQIERQVASGASLTRQLLGFARGGRYEIKPTDMNALIEKTADIFMRMKKDVAVHRILKQDLRTVEVDQGQMEQVFMNLFVNAGQAMPDGGDLTVATENCLLSREEAAPFDIAAGEYVKLSVADTGTGMDENTLQRIFDPFFTTKPKGRGTGLGLAMVYGIIKGHGGRIDVASEPGRGSTFDIYLPASGKAVATEEPVERAIVMGTETILLVDDEEGVLEVSKELLTILGYRLYVAGSGQAAIAIYMEKQHEIDLVILDMIMPGISGGETFDRLRAINRKVRVLLSSGYSEDGHAREILDRGCNGFIQKPFAFQSLSQKVREILDN